MKIHSTFLTSIALAFGLISQSFAANIPGVFSTGVDNFGALLPVGTVDPHYTIAASPFGSIFARTTTTHHDWIANTASSRWINVTASGTDIAVPGIYEYTLTFSLVGFDHTSAAINGTWASDNDSKIFLNGVDTFLSNPISQFGALVPFTLNSGFVAGINELRFVVNNLPSSPSDTSSPTGLQVNVLDTFVQVPEPASFTLVSLGFLACLVRRHGSNEPQP
jgi:hypothetical protein